MTAGAVAAGSPFTVEAGLQALRDGGNAVDAVVAASLMACVAEPLLTGLGGAGMAITRVGGKVEVCDLFSDVPGRATPGIPARPLECIEVDFGPAIQLFHVGAGSVAVPGMPGGLWALHERHGRLPMERLAEPAARAAQAGVPVTAGSERVAQLLWPILRVDPEIRRLFSPAGRPIREGDIYRNPDLAQTLRRFAAEGPRLFAEGEIGQGILRTLGGESKLGLADLQAWQPRFVAPLRYRYRDATVWMPPPSCIAGLLVAQALRALEDHGPMPEPFGPAQVRYLAHALRRAERTRSPVLYRHLFESGFVEGFLAALAPDETGEEKVHGAAIPAERGRAGESAPRKPREPGNTTHISAVDEHGNAAGITHSLGETCGRIVPGTGLLLNNFLGESDVHPPEAELQPGDRLMTMCCPTILQIGDQVHVMGSGGSSRIRSAILHGIVYLTDHALDPTRAVAAPRSHVENGVLHVETSRRPKGTLEALVAAWPNLRRFEGTNMFFGGLHVAGVSPAGFSGAGDPRRSGAFGTTD